MKFGIIEILDFDIKADDWLASRLGFPTFRILNVQTRPIQKLAVELLKQIPKKSFIQSRIPMADLEVAGKLQFLGFKEIEQLITFETSISKVQFGRQPQVRLAVPEDRERVVEIARQAFTYSRFHQDPLIASALADAIKADWTEAYFYGTRGSKMIVALNEGEVSGYLLLIENRNKLVIDLIAVDKNQRGRGLASRMVEYVLEHAPNYITSISAATQENNRASIAFYEALGFTPKTYQLTFHKHGTEFN